MISKKKYILKIPDTTTYRGFFAYKAGMPTESAPLEY